MNTFLFIAAATTMVGAIYSNELNRASVGYAKEELTTLYFELGTLTETTLTPPRSALVCTEHPTAPRSCELSGFKVVHCMKGRTEGWSQWRCSGVTAVRNLANIYQLHIEIIDLQCESASPSSCHLEYTLRKSSEQELSDMCFEQLVSNPSAWLMGLLFIPFVTLALAAFCGALFRLVAPDVFRRSVLRLLDDMEDRTPPARNDKSSFAAASLTHSD